MQVAEQGAPIGTSEQLRWITALLLATSGCQQGGTKPPPTAHTATASSAATSAAPGPSASGLAGGTGPCADKAAGQHACVGKRLLRCGSSETTECLDIEQCDAAAGRCAPKCPEGEVYVPATGPKGFTMGADLRGHMDVSHNVVLTQPFCMDEVEVTAAAFKRCVENGKCDEVSSAGEWTTHGRGKPEHPANNVHWHHGRQYCEALGKSLPTEAQWEWATTEGDGRKWAWGNDTPTCKHADFTQGDLPRPSGDAGCHGGGTSPVKTHPDGIKHWPDGDIHDLSGNVWEWCLDNYAPFPRTKQVDPVKLTVIPGSHVVRGGGWNRSARGILAHYRGGAIVDYQVPGLGFRCVRNPGGGLPAGVKLDPPARAWTPADGAKPDAGYLRPDGGP